MNKLTLLIPANKEAESLPFFLKELGDYNFNKLVVLQSEDVETIEWGETPEADAVINVTSIGLNSSDKIKIDYEKIGHDKFFYDVIYKPSKTIFLKEAEKRGNKIINGKMMFVYQAQKAFELWNNLRPEINDKVLNILDG